MPAAVGNEVELNSLHKSTSGCARAFLAVNSPETLHWIDADSSTPSVHAVRRNTDYLLAYNEALNSELQLRNASFD